MFTSRAEYRLLLRQDNADLRLSAIGAEVGLLSSQRFSRVVAKQLAIADELGRLAKTRVGQDSLLELLRRPENTYASLPHRNESLTPETALQVEISVKYAGYIERQATDVTRFRSLENKPIPADFDYGAVHSLRREAKLKLEKIRPGTLGQASRISGVSPADVTMVMIWMRRSAKTTAQAEPEEGFQCAAEENLDVGGAHNTCCGDL
jgi:tRNA uridine 5-carboxymethylaminomethyl modification enzyme